MTPRQRAREVALAWFDPKQVSKWEAPKEKEFLTGLTKDITAAIEDAIKEDRRRSRS